VFAPKYRRRVIYGSIKKEIGAILRQLCTWKDITIVEAEMCPDHVHMLLEIPPKYSVSSILGFLKGKSSLLIYQKFANMKYKYRNREFWCRGYYVDTVGKNTEKIKEYIANQLKEDKLAEQMSISEFIDPFKK
jgi:putative transposase